MDKIRKKIVCLVCLDGSVRLMLKPSSQYTYYSRVTTWKEVELDFKTMEVLENEKPNN